MTENKNVNIPLLKQAVEWVEAQAAIEEGFSEWNQRYWVSRDNDCGTTYCVAGYLGQAISPAYRGNQFPNNDASGDHVSLFAAKMLGLVKVQRYGQGGSNPTFVFEVSDEGHRLFSAHNTAEDVRRIAEEIAGVPL